jgi:hypothetical protein
LRLAKILGQPLLARARRTSVQPLGPQVIRVSQTGSTRSPVIVIGPFAFKFARNARGRASNIYEDNLYRNSNETRRRLLCPALWVSPNGGLLVVRAAVPLAEIMSEEEYQHAWQTWDYAPGEDSCPFEPKACDWGWFEGRKVALDYSTPAWEDDG